MRSPSRELFIITSTSKKTRQISLFVPRFMDLAYIRGDFADPPPKCTSLPFCIKCGERTLINFASRFPVNYRGCARWGRHARIGCARSSNWIFKAVGGVLPPPPRASSRSQWAFDGHTNRGIGRGREKASSSNSRSFPFVIAGSNCQDEMTPRPEITGYIYPPRISPVIALHRRTPPVRVHIR